MYTLAHADTCLPDYWSGHHLPHISVPVCRSMTAGELRDALREAGSPMVGMLPRKNEIDQSCLDFIRLDEEV